MRRDAVQASDAIEAADTGELHHNPNPKSNPNPNPNPNPKPNPNHNPNPNPNPGGGCGRTSLPERSLSEQNTYLNEAYEAYLNGLPMVYIGCTFPVLGWTLLRRKRTN